LAQVDCISKLTSR